MKKQQTATWSDAARVLLSVVGVYSAGTVTWELLRDVIPTCAPGFQCATVLMSPYMKFGPVSMSYLGFAFFIAMLLISVVLLLDVVSMQQRATLKKAVRWMTFAGALLAIYAIVTMGIILQAWCQYCLISTLALVGLAIVHTFDRS